MAEKVRAPPAAKMMRIVGIGLIVLGVLMYLFYGAFRGSPLDAGAFTMLIVPIVFGAGALLLSRADGANA